MNKSRLILTSLVGTIALGALSLSMSLAWYASGDRLGVSAVDMEIKSDGLLRVSTSKELSTFVTDLDLNSLEEGDQISYFKPVSSMYRENWFANEQKPLFYDCSTADAFGDTHSSYATSGFYQTELYLLSATNQNVGLDVDQSLFENDEATNLLRARQFCASERNASLNLTVDEVASALNKLVDCLRVSILINDVDGDLEDRFFIINPTKQENEQTFLGGRLDNDNDGYYDTYPDVDPTGQKDHVEKEIVYGEVNDTSLVTYASPEDPNAIDEVIDQSHYYFGNSFSAVSKKSAYTFDEQSSLANGLTFKEEGALSLNELDKIVIPCYQNEPRQIIVSIYLEGWDIDCINSTMGASFNTKLSFKLLGGII